MRRRRAVGLVVLALVLAACQGPAAPPPKAADNTLGEAAAALARGDYPKAADLYRRVVTSQPASVPAHYGLGTASTFMADRRDEAIREYQWVVQNGVAGSMEVENARRWLAGVGVAPGVEGPRIATQESSEAAAREARQRQAGNGSVEGHAFVADAQGTKPAHRHLLFFIGQPKGPGAPRYSVRTDEEGNFQIPNVTPGAYMVTDTIGDKSRATWRLRVDVQPSQELRLELNPGNSARVRDDFPNQE